MSEINVSATFKLCIFGDGGVGKTTLTSRFLTGLFDMDTKITLGASIFVKIMEIDGKKISIQIWDFGGEKQFRFLIPVYAHGSSAGIYMFDLTRMGSLAEMGDWISFFHEGLEGRERELPIFMVGGKSDLVDKRSVTEEYACDLCEKHNLIDYIEVSSKTGENVDELIKDIAREMMKNAYLLDNNSD